MLMNFHKDFLCKLMWKRGGLNFKTGEMETERNGN